MAGNSKAACCLYFYPKTFPMGIKRGDYMRMLQCLREQKDWSQDELSRRVGLSQAYISKLENGEKGASAKTLLKLAAVFGVTVDYLLEGMTYENQATTPTTEDKPSQTG
jgi:transcriptional regulator with XRE-family HTH domain